MKQTEVYVVCGTPVPEIPTNLCRSVAVTVIPNQTPTNAEEIIFFETTPVKSFDKWLIEGGTAGFTGDGALRLSSDKYGRCATWIRNTRRVYGVSDYGPIRGNYRFCRHCGRIAGQRCVGSDGEEFFDRDRRVSIIYHRCTVCGHEWEIEKTNGRPRPPVVFQPGVNHKPNYIRQSHNNGKKKRQNGYQLRFAKA